MDVFIFIRGPLHHDVPAPVSTLHSSTPRSPQVVSTIKQKHPPPQEPRDLRYSRLLSKFSVMVGYTLTPARYYKGVDLSESDLMEPPEGYPDSSIKLHSHEARAFAGKRKDTFGSNVLFYDRQFIALNEADVKVRDNHTRLRKILLDEDLESSYVDNFCVRLQEIVEGGNVTCSSDGCV
ncbi:Anthocyanidin 3-O-glucoside 2''-O-glucosyltransferase [Spatholobus suberectus]|nr:Anthocyanidin 3-O-glucoside 2''-O-glucosyltransferase [Spatholobus suberectus]